MTIPHSRNQRGIRVGNRKKKVQRDALQVCQQQEQLKQSACSLGLEDSILPSSKSLETKEKSFNSSKLTPTQSPSYNIASPRFLSTTILEATIPPQTGVESFMEDSHVSARQVQANERVLSIQSQISGLKCSESLSLADLNSSLSKILKGLSIEDYEQCLEDSEWLAIVGTIRSSYQQRSLERRNKETGYSLLPTPTTYAKGSGKCRPAGATKLEQSLRQFISKGDKLHPALPGWMMGFPPGWVEEVLMDGGLNIQLPFTPEYVITHPSDENATTCMPGQSFQSRLRSHSDESCTCPSCERQLIKLEDGCGVCGWMSLNSVLGEIKTHLNSNFPLELEERSPSDESSTSNPSLSDGLTVNSNRSSAISNQILSVSEDVTGKEQSPTANNYSSAVLGETQSLSPLRQRVSVLRCDLHWAQDLVTLRHYLHRPIHQLSLPFAYSINLDGEPVGCIIMATPHFTKKKGLFGYDGLPTKWQVLQIARLWLDPSVQVRASNGHASCIASCAIAKVLKRVQTDWLEHHPPRFPDRPYQIRLILAYADTGVGHQGTIYKAANFKFWGETNKGKPRHSTLARASGSTKLLYIYRLQELRNQELVLGEAQEQQIQTDIHDEPKSGDGETGGQGNSFNVEIHHEPRQHSSAVNNYSAILGEKTSRASGWLEKYTKTKRLKDGTRETYPLVAGGRDPNQISHWFWSYRWEQKRFDGGFTTRAVSLPKYKVEAVELAIALRWSVDKILSFIRGERSD